MSMQLRKWLNDATDAERESLAKGARTSVAYLWQLAGGHRKASLELASRLQAASSGDLTIEGLRPDIHALISKQSEAKVDKVLEVGERRAAQELDERRGRRQTDPTGADLKILQDCAEQALAVAGRLAG